MVLALTGSSLSSTNFYSNNVSGWNIVGRDGYCVASNTQGPVTATIKVTGAFLGLKDLNLYLSNGNWKIPDAGKITVEGHELQYQKLNSGTILIAEVGSTLNDLSGHKALSISSDFFSPFNFNVTNADKALEAFKVCVDKI